MFAIAEGKGFARHLKGRQLSVRYLDGILRLEIVLLDSIIGMTNQKIQFTFDLGPVIDALINHRLPVPVPLWEFEIEVNKGAISVTKNESYQGMLKVLMYLPNKGLESR